jgi:ABC-type Mn2+/Zn2+ transport system ATPase subunit
MKKKLKFILQEYLLLSGRFRKNTFKTLLATSPPHLKKEFSQLWTQIKITRLVTALFAIPRYLLVIRAFLILPTNYKNSLLFFLISILLYTIQYYLSNIIQDKIYLYQDIISNHLISFVKNRSLTNYSKVKSKLPNLIRSIANRERHLNLPYQIILYLVTITIGITNHLSNNLIVVLVIIFVITTAILPLLMEKLYSTLFKNRDTKSIAYKNLSTLSQPIKSLKNKPSQTKQTLHLLALNKSIINSIFTLLMILLVNMTLKQNNLINISILLIILYRTTTVIQAQIQIFIWNVPELTTEKFELLRPLNYALKNTVPTPYTQPTKRKIPLDENFESLQITDLTYKKKTKVLINIPKLEIQLNKGLYTLIGDSGEGKSIFLSLLGNKLLPTTGELTLKRKQENYTYSKLGYWNLNKIINYIWVTKETFENTTPLQIFKLRFLESSQLFKDIIKKTTPDTDLKLLIEKNKDFVKNTTSSVYTQQEECIQDILENSLDKLLFKTKLFKENERHILNTSISKLSGGQQARVITAFYLTARQQFLLLDEGLERTTKSFHNTKDYLYTRERLISFFSYITKHSQKTIILVVQGGDKELQTIKNNLRDLHLGTLEIHKGNLSLNSTKKKQSKV